MRVESGSDIVVDARNVTLSLGAREARTEVLKGIDLAIQRGQSLAILGPSGSGKSSLMAILTGLERATSGHLTVADADFSAMNEDALALARRGRIGIVLQAFHLLPTMTAQENVATPMELAGTSDAWGRAEAELAAVGLAHRLTHYPAQLSGGEQQRVAIARALINEPVLLLADEPTGNLDPDLAWEIMSLFQDINARGTTVLVATHDRELITRMGKRVIVLEQGRVVEQ